MTSKDSSLLETPKLSSISMGMIRALCTSGKAPKHQQMQRLQVPRIDSEELGGKAIQVIKISLGKRPRIQIIKVRMVQGKEPRHFIKMFGGSMVVFSGNE